MEKIHPLVYEYKQAIIGFDPPTFAKCRSPDRRTSTPRSIGA